MIESFFVDYNSHINKIVLPSDLDCRNNYAIICNLKEKECPWDYAQELKITGLNGTYSISATSSSVISIPLFGSFS